MRIVYVPWLKPLMDRIVPNWVAITIGSTVFAGVPVLSAEVMRHEQKHIEQWAKYGPFFPLAYALASLSAVVRGRHWYRDNRFEVEARDAANQA